MAWFADLSPCTYHDWPGERLAVGWLEVDHPFEKGAVTPTLREGALLDRLFWAVRHRSVDKFRGYHICHFCDPTERGDGAAWAERGGGRVPMGDAHIEAIAPDGATSFVAPNLVYHYITVHGYRPPDAFVEAVTLGDFRSDPRPAGQLVITDTVERVVDDPVVEELVFDELARRFGTDVSSIRRSATVKVIWVGRVLASIPEKLPSMSLQFEVTGPTRRSGWTEWAPTERATTAAVDRLFNDPLLVEALEEAMIS